MVNNTYLRAIRGRWFPGRRPIAAEPEPHANVL
jgi:hypothetical protein